MHPKVLVATPTWHRHKHLIERWVSSVKGFTYPNFDIVVAISDNEQDYISYVESLGVKVIQYKYSDRALKRLVDARNAIRQYMLENNFDYVFFIDTDTFVPNDSIERLLSHGKDLVGFLCKIGVPPSKYCVLKSGWIFFEDNKYMLDYYDDSEIESWKPNVVQVYACAMSPMLISRKVFEKIHYIYFGDKGFNIGEDVMFWIWANEQGFKFYIDTSVEAEHVNISWDGVLK